MNVIKKVALTSAVTLLGIGLTACSNSTNSSSHPSKPNPLYGLKAVQLSR